MEIGVRFGAGEPPNSMVRNRNENSMIRAKLGPKRPERYENKGLHQIKGEYSRE